MNLRLHIKDREQYARWVLFYFAVMLAVRFWSGRYLTYIFDQPMKGPDLDYTFWVTYLTGIPQFIIHHLWACKLVDGLVVVILFISFFFPKPNKLFIALVIVFFFEHITVESFSDNHSKNAVCIFMALLPLCFNEKYFEIMVEFVRYFLIFILVSAAYHKFHNGAVTDMDHFQKIQIQQHLDLAILNPNHPSYIISKFLIDHAFIAYLFFLGLVLMQLAFVAGIFTKRFDGFLFFLLFVFVLSTYVLMRIYIWEMLTAGFVFFYDYRNRQTS